MWSECAALKARLTSAGCVGSGDEAARRKVAPCRELAGLCGSFNFDHVLHVLFVIEPQPRH